MEDKENKKENIEKLDDTNFSKQEIFESDQNLIGLFSILLQVDKRTNPQNYKNDNISINL
ncbi:MAG: hypothetical protein WC827_04190 [Candidatus Paceibacterota bacterium]